MKSWSYLEEYKELKKKIFNSIDRSLKSGVIFFGRELNKFESNFTKKYNQKYGIAVGSGTDALYLSLLSMDIGYGDEVITVSNSAIPTVSAIHSSGAVAKFVDVDKNYLIDVNKIEKQITKKTKAIIPVHLYGQSCNMAKICEIARKYKLKIIEDCAQSQGAKYKNKFVGTFGDTGCFSFYPTKNLTTIEGGMIITNNKKIANYAKLVRNHGLTRSLMNRYSSGKPWEYDITNIGYNYRLDDIRSALGINQLKKLSILNKKRLDIFLNYNNGLKNIPGLIVPGEENFLNNSCHLYIIRITPSSKISRDKVFYELEKKGIGTSVHYKPLHTFTLFKKKGLSRDKLTTSKKIFKEILSLPLYPQLSQSSQNYVVKSIRNIFK